MAEIVDYDYKPESGGGKFLNLKAKGDKVTIRIGSKPVTYFVHWLDGSPVICEDQEKCLTCISLGAFSSEDMKKKENQDLKRKQVFVWPVIDRADGKAKIFKAGVGVFLEIGTIARNTKWGGEEKDASLFDVTIERTEASPSKYYSVIPDPTSLSQKITAEEKKAIDDLGGLIDAIVTGKEVAEDDKSVETEKPTETDPEKKEGEDLLF